MAIEELPYRFRVRGGTAADLVAVNEIPLRRELCYELDTGHAKLGDGVTAWNDLPYLPGGGEGGAAWLVGSGVPDPSLGADGDFYLRSTNGDVYAKEAGVWSVVANIQGPAGTPGEDGSDGGPSPVTSIGANTTLGAVHVNRWIEVSNGAEIRLPATGATWPVGSFAELCQADATPFTVVADTGAAIAPHTADLINASRYQGGVVVVKVIAADTWRVAGALADAP